MSRREIGLLALLFAAPGWVVLATLVALGGLAPSAGVVAGVVAGLGTVLLAAAGAHHLGNRVTRLRDWLRWRSDGGSRDGSADAGADVGTDLGAGMGIGVLDDIAGEVRRLERHWRQQAGALAQRMADSLALLDSLPDPVLTLDNHSRVVFANLAARRLLGGGTDKDPAGRPLSSLLRQPALLETIADVAAGDERGGDGEGDFGPTGRQIELTLSGQVERFVEAWIEPMAGAQKARVLVVIRDMTAVRRGEGVRADFVANVSHELRTPLASLLGFIETLRGPAEGDPAARIRFLALMDQQAARMARLVDDLLSLSRIEMNEHQPPGDRVALTPLLQSIADMLAPQAAQKHMQVTIAAPPDLPAALGDADDLTRLFQNLIDNALKYGRAETAVKVTAEVAGTEIVVTVADEGEGIAAEHLSRLTERFYRVDAARSRTLGGTGLGLAIVKHIVNRHKGRLQIESAAGSGSRFMISLPAVT